MTSFAIGRTSAFRPTAIVLLISSIFPLQSLSKTTEDQMLQPVVVTATRSPQKVTDVLSDTVVITSEDIVRSGQTSLIDLLQRQRGVEISRNGGPGNNGSVFLRGSNSNQVVLLIDGVRSVSSTTGAPIWSAVPLADIDHIEIVQGPLSTFYGADAVGGVIQVFTKRGGGTPRLAFSAGAGTYGQQLETIGVSGATAGEHSVRYSLNASNEKADGFSATLPSAGPFTYDGDRDGYDKQSVSGQFGWNLAKGQEIGLSFLNSRNKADFDTGPGFDARSTSDVNTYSIYSRNQLTTNWTSLLQVSRSYSNERTIASYGDSTINSRQDLISWQNDIKFGKDLLQVIAERRKEEVFSTDIGEGMTPNRTTNSLALAYQHRQGAHLLSGSMRNDDNSEYGNHTTANVGYGYSFNEALRLAASYGTSFRAPTYNELFYPFFGVPTNKPEKGKNAEIGLHYDDGKSSFDAVYYRNRITDLLENVGSAECPPGYTFGCAVNVDEALLKGVSVAARTKLNDSFVVRASVDFQDPRNESTDELLSRRAKYHGTAGIDYVIGRFSVGGDIVYSGYRMDGDVRLGGYTLMNLQASYDFTKDWQLFARWNNVFDKNYELAEGYRTPGSNAFVGVRYGFQ